MPHIARVGRRALHTRLLILSIYVALSLGGVTMVVPFWLMLSTSVTSNVDSHDYTLVPKYLVDDEALYQKYTESAYNEDSKLYNYANAGQDIGDFRDVKKPAQVNEQLVKDYDGWKASLPQDFTITLHGYSVTKPKISLMGAHLYQKFLAGRYHNSIQELNRAYRDEREYFDLQVPNEQWYLRVYQPIRDNRFSEFMEFKRGLPSWYIAPAPVEGTYVEFITNKYDAKAETFAKRYGDPTIKSLTDLTLPARMPKNAAFAEDWVDYLRKDVPFHFVKIDPAAAGAWHAYLRKAYYNKPDLYNKVHKDDEGVKPIADLAQVPLPDKCPTTLAGVADWRGFIEKDTAEGGVDPKYVSMDTPQIRYREWLRSKFGDIAKMNAAYGTSYTSFDRVQIPSREADWNYMMVNKKLVRHDFLVRNYRDVGAYIAVHGRALWVTLILVCSTVVLTLTVNPLAAYALSRFNLPSTYKILLFCLATMAFPGEVTAIPNFLLMKKLHLLNSLWALILPGMAGGFAIFLLKGFFDSLPQELYEAAEIDGANEFQMFTKICLPMSTPVLAVIGLGAFTGAYGSFMWAFVVCPDKNWWTLMVWLQQMQSWAPQSMIFAALVLAAIPTLLVFILAQNVIMRGVIIPTEK
ncbi:ABC transporter permease subunit [bacterium]|nr:ABC transporter permease subunit [bacterium]